MINIINCRPLTLVNASLTLGSIGPHAGAGVLVEVQSVGAGQLGELSVNAVVELVADSGIGMGEESVATGAVGVALGGLCGRGWKRLHYSYDFEEINSG